jgi:hypothetical protein
VEEAAVLLVLMLLHLAELIHLFLQLPPLVEDMGALDLLALPVLAVREVAEVLRVQGLPVTLEDILLRRETTVQVPALLVEALVEGLLPLVEETLKTVVVLEALVLNG